MGRHPDLRRKGVARIEESRPVGRLSVESLTRLDDYLHELQRKGKKHGPKESPEDHPILVVR
jgi:hypothetical protein